MRAVAVEMILGDVEQDADRRIERGRKIDLEGRALDDMHAPGALARGGSSDRIAVPILPPSCASKPAAARRCAISAVVVDLPLVPVMAMNGASGAMCRRSRQNSSMSPITSAPALRASSTVQCGSGCVSGTPGASTSAAIFDQSAVAQIGRRDAGRVGLGDAFGVVVAGDDLGAAREQRAGARKARSRRARRRRPVCPRRS